MEKQKLIEKIHTMTEGELKNFFFQWYGERAGVMGMLLDSIDAVEPPTITKALRKINNQYGKNIHL